MSCRIPSRRRTRGEAPAQVSVEISDFCTFGREFDGICAHQVADDRVWRSDDVACASTLGEALQCLVDEAKAATEPVPLISITMARLMFRTDDDPQQALAALFDGAPGYPSNRLCNCDPLNTR